MQERAARVRSEVRNAAQRAGMEQMGAHAKALQQVGEQFGRCGARVCGGRAGRRAASVFVTIIYPRSRLLSTKVRLFVDESARLLRASLLA
jgi:hypothetical protein